MEREYTANITLHELEDRRAFLNSKGISYRIFNSFKDGELFVENNNQDLVIAEFETEAEMDIFLKNQNHIFLYADEFNKKASKPVLASW